MATLTKIANKDINIALLGQESEAAGVAWEGLLIAGFNRDGDRRHQPFTSRQIISSRTNPAGGVFTDSADPGELRFRYSTALTPAQETVLDGILTSHDATQRSTSQINKDKDRAAVSGLVDTYREWNTLTNAQKQSRTRQLFRLVARLIDRTTDV